MTDTKKLTHIIFLKVIQHFGFQLFDDLHFNAVSQEELDEIDKIDGQKGSDGLCACYIEDESLVFVICVKNDLDVDDFLNVFCDEFYHYCIGKVIYKWLDPQLTGKVPPLTSFVSEMLSHRACWDCKHLGSNTCWKHPKWYIPIDESLDDESFCAVALERLNMVKQSLKECLFLKMYNFDNFIERESAELDSSLMRLAELRVRTKMNKKTPKGH